jgi:hypothetical protein
LLNYERQGSSNARVVRVEGSAANIQRFHNTALADPAKAREYVSREWAGAPIAERYEWLFRYDVTKDKIWMHDVERFRLRRFLESLGPEELQRVEAPVALADVAGMLEGNPKRVWLQRAGPEGASLAGNVAGSRSRLATAFGTTPQRLLPEVLRA